MTHPTGRTDRWFAPLACTIKLIRLCRPDRHRIEVKSYAITAVSEKCLRTGFIVAYILALWIFHRIRYLDNKKYIT